MPTTLKDVSLLAGVSLTTVSHVVNGTRAVAEETRTRVLRAIDQSGYTPNTLARSLKTAATRTLGLAIQDINNPYFTEVVAAVESEAREQGYTLILSDFGEDPAVEMHALRALVERRVDGLLIAPSANGPAVLSWLRAHGMPVVQIDRVADPSFDYVVAANRSATYRLVRHLCQHDHRNIAMLVGIPELSTSRERLAGYRRGLADAGVPLRPDLIVAGGSRAEPARQVTRRLLDLAIPPTAIVAGNNLMAIGAMRALSEAGVLVPHDVALVSFDDFEWADLFHPRLTTVAQPCQEIGAQAIRLLIDRIRDPDQPARHTRVKASIRHRESCGCLHPEPL